MKRTNAGRRAGGNDIALFKGEVFGNKRNNLRDGENHPGRVPGLRDAEGYVLKNADMRPLMQNINSILSAKAGEDALGGANA